MVRKITLFRGRKGITSLVADDTEDWPELVKNWEDGINLKEATKAQLKEYTRTKIWLYEIEAFNDFTLWNIFRSDFEGFTAETFGKLDVLTLQSLRICLRCGGVWVPSNSRSLTIYGTFIKVLEEDEQHDWSQDDVKQARPDLKEHTITSVYITPERNLRPEMEARIDAYAQAMLKPPATPQSQPQGNPAQEPALQPAMQPALQPPVSQPPAVPEATPIAPPVASVPAIAIGTTPPLLQPTATSFMPTIATNPVPPYQIQLQHPIQPIQPQPQSQASLGAKLIAEVAKIHTDKKSTACIKATANSKDNPDDLNATKPPQQPALQPPQQPALQPAPQHSILLIQPQPPKLPQALAKQPQPPASLQALATLVPLTNPAKLIVQAYTDDDQRNVPPLGILRVASYPQFQALQREYNLNLDTSVKGNMDKLSVYFNSLSNALITSFSCGTLLFMLSLWNLLHPTQQTL